MTLDLFADLDPRRALVEQGKAVVANMRKGRDEDLITWAKEKGLAVRIDRQSIWGNPFKIPDHGNRQTVIQRYRDYLRQETGLQGKLPDLRGKVLICWCHPEPCHGDVLCEAVNA